MLNIRHFKPTEAEYEAYIEILNKCWPDEPAGTIEEIQFGDREWRKDNLFQRFVLEVDEKMVGVGSYLEPYWLDVKDKYQFQFDILPEFEKCQVLEVQSRSPFLWPWHSQEGRSCLPAAAGE